MYTTRVQGFLILLGARACRHEKKNATSDVVRGVQKAWCVTGNEPAAPIHVAAAGHRAELKLEDARRLFSHHHCPCTRPSLLSQSQLQRPRQNDSTFDDHLQRVSLALLRLHGASSSRGDTPVHPQKLHDIRVPVPLDGYTTTVATTTTTITTMVVLPSYVYRASAFSTGPSTRSFLVP